MSSRVDLGLVSLFCGIGGGTRGLCVEGTWGRWAGRIVPLLGVDVDPGAVAAYERFTGSPGAVLDLFDEAGYRAFHGQAPPAGWREVQPADLRRLCRRAPDIVHSSPPCIGMSRLVGSAKARGERYQAVNALTVRGIHLALEAWADAPPKILLLENVTGLAQGRGARLLGQLRALLEAQNYSVGLLQHCLGDLGGLGARRPRLLLVARHRDLVPPLLFEPPVRGRISVGEALADLPSPGAPEAGPMHQLGRYQWQTWARLALVPAGRDWRALKDLEVADGVVQGLRLVSRASAPAAAAVVDPRLGRQAHSNVYRVVSWKETGVAVTGGSCASSGGWSVADPKVPQWGEYGQLGVCRWSDAFGTVTAKSDNPAGGWHNIADPRRHFRVCAGQAPAISPAALPAATDRGVFVIESLGGAWHRPITTLEAAVLQGFPPEAFGLAGATSSILPAGSSRTQVRRWIGNAVPPAAAAVVGETILQTLLQAAAGESFQLGATPVWAQGVASCVSAAL